MSRVILFSSGSGGVGKTEKEMNFATASYARVTLRRRTI